MLFCILITCKFPGPNEEGLRFGRQMLLTYPHCVKTWFGPLAPVVLMRHSDSMKDVLKSSGIYISCTLPRTVLVACLLPFPVQLL